MKHKRLKKFTAFVLSGVMLMSTMICSYAAKNSLGTANQYKTRISDSLDIDGLMLGPTYYNPYRTYRYGTYSFEDLGLTSEELAVLTQLFNALVDYGFTEEMAAGACGNIWQECTFNPSLGFGGTGACGLVQWMGGRRTQLENLAAEMGLEPSDVNVQIEMIYRELDASYGNALNNWLQKWDKSSYSTVDDVQMACDAWCSVVEGCECQLNSGHNNSNDCTKSACAKAANGISYQELGLRREYSEKIYSAMVRGTLSISEYGLSVPINGSNNAVPLIPMGGDYPWTTLPFGQGSNTISNAGCSITSYSMVISYLLGRWVYPSEIWEYLENNFPNGHNQFLDSGSSGGQQGVPLFTALSEHYGFSLTHIDAGNMTQTTLDQYLLSGYPVILSTEYAEIPSWSKHIFTNGAHFIVITGKDGDGNYYVNDPSSKHLDYPYHQFTYHDFEVCAHSGYYIIH